jgi:hypothetical protein
MGDAAALVAEASQTLLEDLGLTGIPDALLARRQAPMDLAFMAPGERTDAAVEHLTPKNARLQAAIQLVDGIHHHVTPQRILLIQRAATEYCHTVGLAAARRLMATVDDSHTLTPLAVVECGSSGAPPRLRPADDSDLALVAGAAVRRLGVSP